MSDDYDTPQVPIPSIDYIPESERPSQPALFATMSSSSTLLEQSSSVTPPAEHETVPTGFYTQHFIALQGQIDLLQESQHALEMSATEQRRSLEDMALSLEEIASDMVKIHNQSNQDVQHTDAQDALRALDDRLARMEDRQKQVDELATQRADVTDKILKHLTEGLGSVYGRIETSERVHAEGIKSVNQRLESIVSRLDCLDRTSPSESFASPTVESPRPVSKMIYWHQRQKEPSSIASSSRSIAGPPRKNGVATARTTITPSPLSRSTQVHRDKIVAALSSRTTPEAELATNDEYEAGGSAVDDSGHLEMDMAQDPMVHAPAPPTPTVQDVFKSNDMEESGTDNLGTRDGYDIAGVEDGGMDDVEEMMRIASQSPQGTPSGDTPETVRRRSFRPRSRPVDYHSHPLDGKKLYVSSPKKKKGKTEPGHRLRSFKGRVWLNNKCLSASDGEKRGEGVWPAKSENTVKGKMQEVICDACKGRVHWACAGLQPEDDMSERTWDCPDCELAIKKGTSRREIEVAPQDRCIRFNCILRDKKATVREDDDDKQYVVEKIIGRKAIARNQEDKSRIFKYLVLWSDWPITASTWEHQDPDFPRTNPYVRQFMEEAISLEIPLRPAVALLPEATKHWDERGDEKKRNREEGEDDEDEKPSQRMRRGTTTTTTTTTTTSNTNQASSSSRPEGEPSVPRSEV
ncbi:hypothetical protein M231_06280 [Tremella mesenterica]|uniref:Chromo domain-containing protein n=1 Tax=Tremella mesenterica TaxID=5217 RepID=A0A4Q1BE43_TREME|nr:hypothetical protein M231_06280 [Tremella mesenterica]